MPQTTVARVRPAGWWLDAALLAGFAALTGLLAAGHLLGVDRAVSRWVDAHRPEAAYLVARGLNFLGQGLPLTVAAGVLALLLAWRLRSVRPVLLVVAAFVLTTGVIAPLKEWTDRAAPNSTLPDAVELFNTVPPLEYAESYPSGHVVVAVLWWGVVLALVDRLLGSFGRPIVPDPWRRVIRFGPPAVVLVTTTYLDFHWLTDGLAALMLGVLLDRLLWRIPILDRG